MLEEKMNEVAFFNPKLQILRFQGKALHIS